ncbi:MAG: FUSC family protein [Hymenobacter sp.]
MAVACAVAFAVAELLWHGAHNYWVLMTVTIMLKPGFSLTRERNTQRIVGTLLGGALGALVLWGVPSGNVRFGLLLGFMLVAYSFQRTKYLVMVVFLTAYLLIMFSFLGLGYLGVIEERLTDTVLGCAIALATAYLLFPRAGGPATARPCWPPPCAPTWPTCASWPSAWPAARCRPPPTVCCAKTCTWPRPTWRRPSSGCSRSRAAPAAAPPRCTSSWC